MLEVLLCSLITILPDYLYRRFAQGKRLGREITFFSVWYELRYGITACFILTISLITVVFFYHPSSTAVTVQFRTIPILPDASGRVEEVFVTFSDEVQAGDPLFRLDTSRQEAAVETQRRVIAEADAAMTVAAADIAAADGNVSQARAALQNAQDQLQTRQQLAASGSNAVAAREIETLEQNAAAAEGALAAAEAARTAAQERLNTLLPAQKATAQAALEQAEIEIEKSTIRAGVNGRVEQFTLRPGDYVSPILRSAGLLIPTEAGRQSVQAGFGQIAAPVIKVGMIGEIACDTAPWQVIPVTVAEKQDYIATGQFGGGERLVDVGTVARDGTVTVYFEPLYQGGFASIVPGSQCIANLYSNHHDEIEDPNTSTTKAIALHAVDALGLVHALLMRMQVAMMPFRTLVFSGGH
ncbi:HlyD family secretion protein [Paracoccus aurantiacus]|uniref:HlyD family secretion protein n=1 Tax=Paracoccus aurantiacus TaxID=2599412 RepID=A0A5C6S5K4_9RHOB|nr:biotin/lipoyl-binding protein [Paracoccus aurantiacus]TXB69713.1 HlyD family secretion protein [Paracoccus aurantiacus]